MSCAQNTAVLISSLQDFYNTTVFCIALHMQRGCIFKISLYRWEKFPISDFSANPYPKMTIHKFRFMMCIIGNLEYQW